MKSLILLTAILISGCNQSKPNVELIQDMFLTPAVKAQESDANGNSYMRLPPEGTVPQGYVPYEYKDDPEGAGRNLKNALTMDEASLARGKKHYEIHCALCHGMGGAGDGQIAAKMSAKPPPLNSDKVKGWSDGRIFHVATAGQGVMGPYGKQIPDPKDRWAIVNYIRKLQKQ